MSVAGSLREREQAGNKPDSLNPAQANFDSIVSQPDMQQLDQDADRAAGVSNDDTYTDTHGDTVQKNWNADTPQDTSTDLGNKEGSPSSPTTSLYTGDNAPQQSQGRFGQLFSNVRIYGKQMGATGGIIGMLLMGFLTVDGGTVSLASSLLVNIKEIFHNDRSDGTRTNRLVSRALLGSRLQDKECSGNKIKCKISTWTKSLMKKYKENGFNFKGKYVDADGKDTNKAVEDDKSLDPNNKDPTKNTSVGDDNQRARITEIQTPPDTPGKEGKWVKNGKDFFKELGSNIKALKASELAFSSKASFYTNKFFSNVLKKKFDFTKGKKAFPNGEEDPNEKDPEKAKANAKKAQDDAFNSQADGLSDADKNGEKLKTKTKEISDDSTKKHLGGGTDNTKKSGRGGLVTTIANSVCQLYKLSNAVTTAVKVYHAAQLVKFALIFLQAADEIKDGRGDGPKTTYLSNNITSYESNPKNADGTANPKYNLSGTDAQAYKIAAMGDQSKLTDFARNYLIGGNPKGLIGTLDSVNKSIDGAADKLVHTAGTQGNGRQSVRDACRAINGSLPALAGACVGIGGALEILGSTVPGVGNILGAIATTFTCTCQTFDIIGQAADQNSATKWIKDGFKKALDAILGATSGAPIVGPVVGATLPDDMPGRQYFAAMAGTGNPCEAANYGLQGLKEWLLYAVKSKAFQEELVKLLKEISVGPDTKGVDTVNAIGSGVGAMMSVTSTGYGMKPASNKSGAKGKNQDISNYITYTQPLEDTYIALDKQDARDNPFDATNQYSLMGNIVRSLNLTQTSSSSLFSNLMVFSSIIPTAFTSILSGKSASALYNQPSTAADGNSERYDQCHDDDLSYLGATGDAFCSIVAVTPTNELNDASDQAYNPDSTVFDKLIDRMTNTTYGDENNSVFSIGCTGTTGAEMGCDQTKLKSIDDNGKPIANSQYDKYLHYCTDQRTEPWGAQAEGYEQGTDRDQRWYSGQECMFDVTNPDSYKNGGGSGMSSQEEAQMVSDFREWTNVCLQVGTADGTSDCYTEDYDTGTAANVTSSTCASNGDTKNIYTCALKYDNYRYKWGGGHGDVADAKQWITNFNTGQVPEWTPILDCSGLVRMAFVEAMGIEDQAYTAPGGYDSSKYWEKIPLEQAQQGDIVTSSGHVAIVEANDPGAKMYKIFDAETDDGAKEANIRHSTQDYGKTIAAYRARKVTAI